MDVDGIFGGMGSFRLFVVYYLVIFQFQQNYFYLFDSGHQASVGELKKTWLFWKKKIITIHVVDLWNLIGLSAVMRMHVWKMQKKAALWKQGGIRSGKSSADRNGTERILLFFLKSFFHVAFVQDNKRISFVPFLSAKNFP